MATHNIKLPDGTTVAVPAWATERTLEQLASVLNTNNDLAALMVTQLGGLGKDADEFKESLEKLRKVKAKSVKKQTEDINRRTKELGRTITGVMNKFQDTDKPLTAMVDMVSDLGEAGAGAAGKLIKNSQSLGKFSGVLGNVGKVMGDIGTAGAAYAGFVAGKIEQFAEVQRTLIDSGAIFFETSQAFDDLRRRSYDAGISYQQLGKVVSDYGVAIQALGNGVTGGTDQFVAMFTDLNTAADSLGDFGLTSNDMATAYADYIDAMRLTSSINRDTNLVQQDLQNGFANLMVETTALANLTGENRSDILKRQMSALKDVEIAGGVSILKERGQLGQAKVAESIAKQFALIEPETGAVGKAFSQAFSNELLDAAGNIGRFEIRNKLDPAMQAAVEQAMPGLLDRINQGVRTGEIENAGTFLTNAFLEVRQQQLGAGQAERGSMIDLYNQLKASSVALSLSKGRLKGFTDADMAAQSDETKKKLAESGKSTVAMNNLNASFLKMQDAIIPDLANASDALVNITETINAGADKISSFFGVSMTTQRRMKMIDAKIQQKAKGVGDGATKEELDDMVKYLRQQARNDMVAAGGGEKLLGYLAKLTGVLGDPLEDFFGTGSKQDGEWGMGYSATELSNMYRQREGLAPIAPAQQAPATAPTETTTSQAAPNLPGTGTVMPDGSRMRTLADARRDRVAGARAAGGPVSAGSAYLVGEQGPEIVAPGNSGTVINNGGLKQIMALVYESVKLAKIIKSEDLGQGMSRNTRADGSYETMGSDGKKVYDANGNLIYSEAPNLAGVSQRTYADGSTSTSYAQGPMKASQIKDASGALVQDSTSYDMGIARVSAKKNYLTNEVTAGADVLTGEGTEHIDMSQEARQGGGNTVELAKRFADLVKQLSRKAEGDKQLASTDN